MTKRFALSASLAIVVWALTTSCLCAQVGQSEAYKALKEAAALHDSSEFPEVKKKALVKYKEALQLAEKAGLEAIVFGASLGVGTMLADLGHYQESIPYHQKALAVARKGKVAQAEGMALGLLGEAYVGMGRHDNGIQYSERSLVIARENGDTGTQMQALRNLGRSYFETGQYEKAIQHFEKMLDVARRTQNSGRQATAQNDIARAYRQLGQHEKAITYCKAALSNIRKTNDFAFEARILRNLGTTYLDRCEYDNAVQCFENAAAASRKVPDTGLEGLCLIDLGVAFYQSGEYGRAVAYHEKALMIAEGRQDAHSEATALTNIGNVYLGWRQYDKALDYYQRALAKLPEAFDPELEGSVLNNLGSLYTAWGQYGKALEQYQKALAATENMPHTAITRTTLHNLGRFYSECGQYENAVQQFLKSLNISKQVNDRKTEFKTRAALGSVYQDSGKYDKALGEFTASLEICESMRIPSHWQKKLIGDLYLDMGEIEKAEPLIRDSGYSQGRLQLLKGDYEKARESFERQLRSGEDSRDAELLFYSHTALGMVCEAKGDNTSAAEHYQDAAKYTEEIRSSLGEAQRAKFFNVRVEGFFRTGPFKGLARVRMKLDKVLEAFKESERTKARSFSEALSSRHGKSSVEIPEEVLKKDSLLNEQLAALIKKRQEGYEKANRRIIETVGPQITEGNAKLAEHIDFLRKRYPLFAATKYPEPMDLSQTALRENERVLEYDVTDSGLLIYLTKGKKIVKAFLKSIPQKEVDALVQEFRKTTEFAEGETILEKVRRFDFPTAKKLTDLLLSDILPDLPKEVPLIIVPDGQLGLIPFEMLVLNTGGQVKTDKTIPYVIGAEFFGDRNPISYYQSVTALTLARTLKERQKRGTRTLAVVDPVFSRDDKRQVETAAAKRRARLDPITNERLMAIKTELGIEFYRLPLTSQLGEALKKADPANTDLYQGLDAQKSLLLTRDLTPYKYCVFGTHGDMGKALPAIQEPVLFLTLVDQPAGQDGFLRMSEVMGKLKMNADMVALTACQSGLGRTISGEGTMGMGRAFQYAGAKSVLMSLWSVAQESSVDLVTGFFKHLREGKNKLEALKLARDEIRKAGYDHPFFWAPFILVGEVE